MAATDLKDIYIYIVTTGCEANYLVLYQPEKLEFDDPWPSDSPERRTADFQRH
jgi:hypothetical protein